MKIAEKNIDSNSNPYVIAEISANHNGSLDRALEIVRLAAENGADAIKLQTYKPETLTINSCNPEFYINDSNSIWVGKRLWDLYQDAHTPWEWHSPIFSEAKKRGLACISTVFDKTSIEFLLGIGVDALKIASFELIHTGLIRMASDTNKPLLLSTGMASLEEVSSAVDVIRSTGNINYALLKCTSAYPADESDSNILTMRDMQDRFGCLVGISDHTLTNFSSYSAVSLGGVIIEKHFTISRSDGGLDSGFSIEPSELNELVKGVRTVKSTLGKVDYSPLSVESTSMQERPSIYVVKDIKKGERFTNNNIKVIRPSMGIKPKFYDDIIGKKSCSDIDAGLPLSWEHF